jgi:hypothetical protein
MFEEIVPGGNINFLLCTSGEKKGSVYNKNRNIPYRESTQWTNDTRIISSRIEVQNHTPFFFV